MPIRLNCQCGKALNVPDTMAGKAVKCPGCATVIKVPTAGAATASPNPAHSKPAQPRPAQPAANAGTAIGAGGGLNDMFDEEGFSAQVAAVCPACRVEMAVGSVFCTKCGYHKETGERLESHKTAGVDIDAGTLMLMKAEADLTKGERLQKEMQSREGMPWWMLALILFVFVSGVSIAVLTVNASRRVDETLSFNPMATFLMLAGVSVAMVAIGAWMMIVVHAFKQEMKTGLMTLFIFPFYAFYHVFKNFRETWAFMLVAIVLGSVGGGLLMASINAGQSG